MDKISLLFVEDEPDIRFIVELALARSNFTLTTFDSGRDALDALFGSSNSFDLALVNFQLPTMTGPEFMRRLRQFPTFEVLPFILVTAMVFGRGEEEPADPYLLGVISKPFDATALGESIKALLPSK
ncbi:MAG: response regulator [Sphingobium sp.]